MGNMKDIGLLDCEDRPSVEENFKRVAKNHGYISTEEKTVEFDAESGGSILDGFPAFKVGDTVTVKVDDVEYSLVANEFYGSPYVGDTPEELGSGNYKYGWFVAYVSGNLRFGGMEPHTVSWKTTKNHPIDHKLLPEGYPYVVKEKETVPINVYSGNSFYDLLRDGYVLTRIGERIFTDPEQLNGWYINLPSMWYFHIVANGKAEFNDYDYGTSTSTVRSLSYEVVDITDNGGKKVGFDMILEPTTDNGVNYAFLFLFKDCVINSAHLTAGIYLDFTTSSGPMPLESMTSCLEEEVVPLAKKFLPPGIGGGALILTTTNIYANKDANGISSMGFSNLFYDDGTGVIYNNMERLITALNSGQKVIVVNEDGYKWGEVWAAFGEETSDGYGVAIRGYACKPRTSEAHFVFCTVR